MDSTSTSLFDSYEQDFQQILQNTRDKLEGDGTDQRGGSYGDMSSRLTTTLLYHSPRAKEGGPTQSRDGTR
jgi:hypothetical protein